MRCAVCGGEVRVLLDSPFCTGCEVDFGRSGEGRRQRGIVAEGRPLQAERLARAEADYAARRRAERTATPPPRTE